MTTNIGNSIAGDVEGIRGYATRLKRQGIKGKALFKSYDNNNLIQSVKRKSIITSFDARQLISIYYNSRKGDEKARGLKALVGRIYIYAPSAYLD